MSEFVYVIEHELGPLKIGKAKNPERRLRELQTSCPYALELRQKRQTETARAVEQYLHGYFSRYRRRGEWFDIPPSERDFEIPPRVEDGQPSTRPLEDRGRDIREEWADTFERLIDAYDETRYATSLLEPVRRELERIQEVDLHD